jgi:hypothetical protein
MASPRALTVNPDGGGKHQLNAVRASSLAWSPDGKKLAFEAGSQSSGGTYVMNPDGRAVRLLSRLKKYMGRLHHRCLATTSDRLTRIASSLGRSLELPCSGRPSARVTIGASLPAQSASRKRTTPWQEKHAE